MTNALWLNICAGSSCYIVSFLLQAGRKTLADKYDYVMHGKLYKISEETKAGQLPKVYDFSQL
jgi:hypothetical protein